MADGVTYLYPETAKRLPETVEIGPFQFNIYGDPAHVREMQADCPDRIGWMHPKGLLITIEPSLPRNLYLVTLLHELIHAALFTIGAPDEMEHEQVAELLSTALFDMFRRNPNLVEFLWP